MYKEKAEAKQNFLVLLVEDRKDQAIFLTKILDANNYRVVWVKDGLQALELVRKGMVPDLMVTDIKMPTLSGFELMTEMKRMEIEVPTIVTSGTGTTMDFEEAYSLGAKSYLVKPFSPVQFLSRVQKIFDANSRHGKN